MSQNCPINKDLVNSVPWENMQYIVESFHAEFLWDCFSCWESSNSPLPAHWPGCPCSQEVPVVGFSQRFKRGRDFGVGKKTGSELRRNFLHDPVNFRDIYTWLGRLRAANQPGLSSVLWQAGLPAAPSTACPNVHVSLLCLGFRPSVVKEEWHWLCVRRMSGWWI